ncbi:MAG: YceI family protein [Anaerolineae bacterium]
MVRWILVVALGLVALAVAACGGANTAAPASAPAAVSTTAPAAKTQSDAPTTAPAQPTAAPAAKSASAQPTAASATKSAAPAQGAAAAGALKLSLVPENSEARFLVKEQLAGNNLPNDAVGKTKTVQGTIVLGQDAKVDKSQSKITVDVNSLSTDQPMRDGFIKRSTLETDKFPTAEFVPTEVKGLVTPLPKSGPVNFQLTGDMTVHGTTKPITWDVTGTLDGNTFKGTAKTAVKFADFNMNPPKVPRVLSLEDNIRLEFDTQFNISSGSA